MTGGGKDGAPEFAIEVDAFATGSDHVDGNMGEVAMEVADDESGAAGHGSVDGVAAEAVAEECVIGAGRASADLVAGVEVAHGHFDADLLEVFGDFVADVDPDVLEFGVSGKVFFGAAAEDVLACAFGDDDDGVAFGFEAFLQGREEAVGAIEAE